MHDFAALHQKLLSQLLSEVFAQFESDLQCISTISKATRVVCAFEIGCTTRKGRLDHDWFCWCAQEQAKIAKLGLEMKLITSEMDAETEKWDSQSDNEIVRRAKNMSSMAFSMYLFTRGEGPLKTTQVRGSCVCGQETFLKCLSDPRETRKENT